MINEARGSIPESLFAFSIQAPVDAPEGVKMTVAEICVAVYLVAAIPAAVLIWSALMASKRRSEHLTPAKPVYSMKYRSLRERHIGRSQLYS